MFVSVTMTNNVTVMVTINDTRLKKTISWYLEKYGGPLEQEIDPSTNDEVSGNQPEGGQSNNLVLNCQDHIHGANRVIVYH